MYRFLKPVALAAVAAASATEEVNVFVCDHQNKPIARQALSHGQTARICIQSTDDGFSLDGLDALL
jgi:hypothetical protein